MTVSNEEQLSDLTGKSLKEEILKYTGHDFQSYCNRKLELLNKLGYESVRQRSSFKTDCPIESIVDFAIGIVEKLPVKDLKVEEDIRFNIPGQTKMSESGFIQLVNPTAKVKWNMRNGNGTKGAEFDADFFSPKQLIRNIPDDKYKYRINSCIGEIIGTPDNCTKFNLNLSFPQEATSLVKLKAIANSISILSCTKSEGCIIEIIHPNSEKALKYELSKNAFDNIRMQEYSIKMSYIIQSLWFLAKQVEIFNSKIRISEIESQHYKIVETRLLNDILENNLAFEFTLKNEADLSKPFALPCVRRINFGDVEALFSGYFYGNAKIVNKKEKRYKMDAEGKIYKPPMIIKSNFLDLDKESKEMLAFLNTEGFNTLPLLKEDAINMLEFTD